MTLSDQILAPANAAESVFKDRGSKFIGYFFHVKEEAEAKALVQTIKKQHPAAVHWCWAYVIGLEGEITKSTDDREPSGSAGKPILNAILKQGLTQTLLIVVRYFGGKLLGVPGLINAYGSAASEAIALGGIERQSVQIPVFVVCDFEQQHQVIRIAKQLQLKVYPDFLELNSGISIETPPSKINELKKQLIEARFVTYHLKDIKLYPC
jgi:uncharacterized YigZ family protein